MPRICGAGVLTDMNGYDTCSHAVVSHGASLYKCQLEHVKNCFALLGFGCLVSAEAGFTGQRALFFRDQKGLFVTGHCDLPKWKWNMISGSPFSTNRPCSFTSTVKGKRLLQKSVAVDVSAGMH